MPASVFVDGVEQAGALGTTVELGELNLPANSTPHVNNAGNAVAVSSGAAATVLTSNGPTAVPSYQAVPGSTPGEYGLVWTFMGTVNVAVPLVAFDGIRPVRRAGSIQAVYIALNQRGSDGGSGQVVVDVNKHTPAAAPTTQQNGTAGTTIFTTQANRPTITGSAATPTENAIFRTAAPDVTAYAADDFLTCDIDDDGAADAVDLSIVLIMRDT